MPRAIGLLRFLAASIGLLTASSVMAENAITVYGPTPFDEKLIQVPDQRIVLMPGETSIRKFPTPFKTFHIANPDLINILPLNDTTVLITGKKFGNTDIDILGDKSEPIAKLPVSVVFGPARDIYLRPDTFTIVQFVDKVSRANVADPNIADAKGSLVASHTLEIRGLAVGDTEIVVFGGDASKGDSNSGSSAEPLARYTVHVTERGPVEMGRGIGVSDGATAAVYWCLPGSICRALQ